MISTSTDERNDLMPDPEFVMRVLTAFAMFPNDLCEYLTWRVDGQFAPITFLAMCSDDFAWATADCEPVAPETVEVLESAFTDLRAVSDPADWSVNVIYAPMLYAARIRGMRPQGAAYPKDERLWPLFDACGPEREVGFGNPYRPGEYKPFRRAEATS